MALAAATAASALQGAGVLAAPREPSAQSLPVVPAAAPAAAPKAARAAAAPAAAGSVQLKVRRLPDALELVIEGTGSGPQLQQSSNGNSWAGQLTTAQATGLRLGPQRLSLPEVGLQTITLEGSGRSYRISVTPMPGYPVSRPVVSADGNNLILSFASAAQASLQTNRLDMTAPGRVPQPAYAPPLQPRAVAPPLGDMAVGSMILKNRGYVNISGPSVTMTMKNAPAREVLLSLAQMGGYGFAYVEDVIKSEANISASSDAGGAQSSYSGSGSPNPNGNGSSSRVAGYSVDSARITTRKLEQQILEPPPVTVSFRNESYSRALNFVLLTAGLQGRLEGSTLVVGRDVLGKTIGNSVSKVYRLNQASASAAADYLASLGASITKVTTITNTVSQGTAEANQVAGAPTTNQTKSQSITSTETYGASTGPLRGLSGSTDSRLQTVTLVGDPALVETAANYLRQIDLRQRQVALTVRILDVTLDNDNSLSNSFAFRYGNNFIVNNNGELSGVFNKYLPPNSDQFTAMATGNPELVEQNPILPPRNPGAFNYPKDNFFDYVKAKIDSRSTKVLASPTLILSENADVIEGGAEISGGDASSAFSSATIGRTRANESFVTVGTQVITNYQVQAGQNGAPNTCQPQFGTSGLTFGARISKIDDNGFVTFSMSPSVSATTGAQEVEGCGPISILSLRRLDTGTVRVRDGQTLILTGVISDSDSQAVTKWPILGDLPLIGQFFRGSSGNRKKNELVIMVTPQIVNDDQGGQYGYGYRPVSSDAREFVRGN